MLENYFIKGLLVGLVFGVPAGAIGALTIQRSVTHGFLAGLFTGLGSSAADVLYACVGVFGLTIISDFLLAHQRGISFVGGAIIVSMGVLIFGRRGTKSQVGGQRTSLPICFGSAFAVAISNPATILSFLVAFASFGIAQQSTPAQGMQLIMGILLGTGCWWTVLSGLTAAFRRRITEQIDLILNCILGSLMVLFGAVMIFQNFL